MNPYYTQLLFAFSIRLVKNTEEGGGLNSIHKFPSFGIKLQAKNWRGEFKSLIISAEILFDI